MYDIETFIIVIFILVDDFVNKYFPPRKLRKRGILPKLSDSEVITMEIVGEFLGFHSDKDIYKYFKNHWKHLFPNLPHRSNFVRQAFNLWYVKLQFWKYLISYKDKFIQIIDSIPMEVCKFKRAKRSKLFKGLANYGKYLGMTFYGFRLHLKITDYGLITDFVILPANYQDIEFVDYFVDNERNCYFIGDKGYRSKDLFEKLLKYKNIFFHTSYRRIDKKPKYLPKYLVKKLNAIRKLIETIFSQLEKQFAIKKICARDKWHLYSRVVRKIVTHVVAVILNIKNKRSPLEIKDLIR